MLRFDVEFLVGVIKFNNLKFVVSLNRSFERRKYELDFLFIEDFG